MPQRGRSTTEQRNGRVIIERDRLLRLIDEASARTVLLVAPAGYGKTTLARQWMAERHRGVTVASDVPSSGPVAFVEELLGTLDLDRRSVEELLTPLRLAGHDRTALRRAGRKLAGLLSENAVEAVFIDDFHTSDAQVGQLVDGLRNAATFKTLVASRSRPSWASARAEIYDTVLLISHDELRFTPQEISQLGACAEVELPPNIAEQSGGWPLIAGLSTLSSSVPPTHMNGAALAEFFTNEVIGSMPTGEQLNLELAATLPRIDERVATHLFGNEQDRVIAETVRSGLGVVIDGALELHPVLREHLLDHARRHNRFEHAITLAVNALLRAGRLDDAILLTSREARRDLVQTILESAGASLIRTASPPALGEMVRLCRGNPTCPPALLDLMNAELALRAGDHPLAEELARFSISSADMTTDHESYACLVAGHAAFASSHASTAASHFAMAQSLARTPEDARDAAWGLALSCIFGELGDLRGAVEDLAKRRNDSEIDLLRWSIARLADLRLTEGIAEIGWLQQSYDAASSVVDLRSKTSFYTSYSYYKGVRAEYEVGLATAVETLKLARTAELGFVIPHAQWNIAFCGTGLRRFGESDKYLRRVEEHAARTGDRYLSTNAAILRSRRLLMLGEREVAHEIATSTIESAPSAALRSELIAVQVAAAALGGTRIEISPSEVSGWPIESRSMIALAYGLHTWRESRDPKLLVNAVKMCQELGSWDSLVCVGRAAPDAINAIAELDDVRPLLLRAFKRPQDLRLVQSRKRTSPVTRSRPGDLTQREQEVLDLLRSGLKNREIARALFISEATAKVHVRHILTKLGAKTRTAAAVTEI